MSEYRRSKAIIQNAFGKGKYSFYTMNGSNQYVNMKEINLDAKTSEYEIFRDYKEHTIIDHQVDALLLYRKNWKRELDPVNSPEIDLSWVGSDISIEPKYTTFKDETWEFLNKEQQDFLVKVFMNKLAELKNRKITKENAKEYLGAPLNRLYLSKSHIGNRLTKLTRWTGNKMYLYRLIRSYAGSMTKEQKKKSKKNPSQSYSFANDIIPYSFEININDPDYKDIIIQKLEEKESSSGGQLDIWVVRPTSASRGVGMRFKNKEQIKNDFTTWAHQEYEETVFEQWAFSQFKQSFLWKVENNYPESLRLCDWNYTKNSTNKTRKPQDIDRRKNVSEHFNQKKLSYGLWDKCTVSYPEWLYDISEFDKKQIEETKETVITRSGDKGDYNERFI